MSKIHPYIYVGLETTKIDKPLEIDFILNQVRRAFGVINLSTKSRNRELVEARHAAMFLIRKHTSLSLTEAGQLFNRDHATVLHAIKNVKNLIETDKAFRNKFLSVEGCGTENIVN